ncbi:MULTISPECIES: transposase [Streptomyces]|uniref:transposase n=1 Tax=Streptomyces TaxID=1883 RepID=UPI00131D711C
MAIRPQSGGRRRAADREALTAIIFVATSGCAWRQLPPVFGPAGSRSTAGAPIGARAGSGRGSTA